MPLSIPQYITVKNAAGQPVAYLSPEADALKEVWPDAQLNGPSSMEFSLPLRSEKWAYLTDSCRIEAGGREYVILKPDAIEATRDGQKLWGKIAAQESWILLDKDYVTVSNDPQTPNPPWSAVIILSGGTPFPGCVAGSAKNALSYLLDGTGWTVGTVDVTGARDLETEKESLLANINRVQELWGGYLVWDSLNKVVHLRKESAWQSYTGFQIRYAKNLKHITRTADLDIVTRLYPFGQNDLDIGTVNDGKLYLENFQHRPDVLQGIFQDQNIFEPAELKEKATEVLDKLSKPRYNYQVGMVDLRTLPEYRHENFALGDMVDVIDEDLGANARVRVIRHRYNLFQPWQCELEVGDPLESIAAMIDAGRQAADFVNSVKPNAGFRNLLKGFLDNAAVEINGASGDYTCVNGVATWKERVDGQLTGLVTRISPAGWGISSDGGQTFVTAATGAGVAAGVIIGELVAGGQLTITNEAGNFLVDSAGAQISDLTLTVTRSDGKSKVIISPTDGIKIQKDGADKFYADADGNLVAEDLTANRLIVKTGNDVLIDGPNRTIDFSKFLTLLGEVEVDNVPLYQLIEEMNASHQEQLSGEVLQLSSVPANRLVAEKVMIAELTVDQLDTSDKVKNYLNNDTSDVNYIKIYDQNILFITASYAGGVEQAKNRYGLPLYWIDDSHTGATTTETESPVMVYTYTEYVKMSLLFEYDGANYTPKLILGAGTGTSNYGKGYIYKGTDGLYIEYITTTGKSKVIKLTEDSLDLSAYPTVNFAPSANVTGITQIWVQPDIPASPQVKDVWIDTDDFSRYDKLAVGATTALLASDPEIVTAEGTLTITLPGAATAGLVKKVYNIGTGIVTIAGTINGATNMYLYPGESAEFISDGSGWRC